MIRYATRTRKNKHFTYLLKSVYTILVFTALLAHTFWSIKVDTISLSLLVLLLIPWVLHYVKSFEINGVGKIELNKDEVLEVESELKEANVKEIVSPDSYFKDYVFYKIFNDGEKQLGLAGLRIELEKALAEIAVNEKESQSNNYRSNLNRLHKDYIISDNEEDMLIKIFSILNQAIHNGITSYDSYEVRWVWDTGLKILQHIKSKKNSSK